MNESAAPRRAPRLEGILFACLCAIAFAHWVAHFEPFLVPNNDFPSFEATARSLAQGELPRSYQRMPIFPALMALLAPLLPSPHPYLHAALVWNLFFSLGTLALLFALASRLLGPGALLVPALTLAASQFQSAALQPLVEPSLGFFVVLGFVLFERRSAWQYAAAFAAALSRYEAALLIPVLVLASCRRGSALRHFALGALAASGVVAWAGLGALQGTGTQSYLAMMEGTGFLPELAFLMRSIKEPLRGWFAPQGIGLVLFVAATGIPLVAGLRRGIREFPRETAALLGFWVLCIASIVGFGIAKPRYVYPTQWILLFFLAAGVLELAKWAAEQLLPRFPPWLRTAAAAGAFGGAALFSGRWLVRYVDSFHLLPPVWDWALLAGCLIGLLGGLAWLRSKEPLSALGAGLAALALLVPLSAGGLVARSRDAYKIHYSNYGTWLTARWAGEHLEDSEGMVAFGSAHIAALTGMERSRTSNFASSRAADSVELAAYMRRRGLTHVAYTARHPTTRSDQWFDQKARVDLARAFADGTGVPGFVLVTTLTPPAELNEDPVHIYRLEALGVVASP